MIYFEYDNLTVKNGNAPARICQIDKGNCLTSLPLSYFHLISLADQIYKIEGNILKYLKNRYGALEDRFISDEEKIILALKAVRI